MISSSVTLQPFDIGAKLGARAAQIQEGAVLHVAEWLRFTIRKSFQNQSTAEGTQWVPLSPAYAARKKGAGILRESGAMFEQATRAPEIDGNTVTAGSTLPYASVHQLGFEGDVSVRAMIRKVKSRDVMGKMLGKNNKIVRGKIAMGIGNVASHTRHMNIPARPYLPSEEFVQGEGAQVAKEFVQSEIEAGLEGNN